MKNHAGVYFHCLVCSKHCIIYTVWYTLFVYIYLSCISWPNIAPSCIFSGCLGPFSSQSRLVLCATPSAPMHRNANLRDLSFSTFGIIVIVLNLAEKATAIKTDLVILLSLWFSINLATFRPCLAKLLLTPFHNQALHAKDTAERFRRLTMTS